MSRSAVSARAAAASALRSNQPAAFARQAGGRLERGPALSHAIAKAGAGWSGAVSPAVSIVASSDGRGGSRARHRPHDAAAARRRAARDGSEGAARGARPRADAARAGG